MFVWRSLPLEHQKNDAKVPKRSLFFSTSGGDRHLPDANLVIRVTSKQSLAISRPSHRQTLGRSSLGRVSWDFGFELFNHVLAFQIPNLDRWASGSAQPVTVGGEAKGVDGVGVIQSVQMFAIIEIPQHCFGVLAAGGTQRTVGRHGYGVQVSGVSEVVGLEPAVGQVPDLDIFIPAARHNDGVLVVGGEPNARNPFSVTLLLDGVFALSQSIPQLDGLVSGSTDNLPVIGRKSNAQNIVAVIFKTPGGTSSGQIPQSQVLVPRSGQGKVSIRREDNIRNKVSVSMETLLGDSIVLLIAG